MAVKPVPTPVDSTIVIGITLPNQNVTLAAIPEGVIASVAVTEGQAVRKGDLLVAMDDRVARIASQITGAKAQSTLQIDLAKARLDWAIREMEYLRTLNSQDAASRKEAEDAAVQAEVTRLEHAVARFEHEQAQREHDRQGLLLDEFSVRAPFDGYVMELLKRTGEAVEQREPVIKLVQLDPLEVRLDCPVGLARMVRAGDRLQVRPLDERWAPREGCVTVLSPMADPASQTRRIKLSVSNQDAGWIAGLKVAVDLSARIEASATPEEPRGAGATSKPTSRPAGIQANASGQ